MEFNYHSKHEKSLSIIQFWVCPMWVDIWDDIAVTRFPVVNTARAIVKVSYKYWPLPRIHAILTSP